MKTWFKLSEGVGSISITGGIFSVAWQNILCIGGQRECAKHEGKETACSWKNRHFRWYGFCAWPPYSCRVKR